MSGESHPFLKIIEKHYASIPPTTRIQQQPEAWQKFVTTGLPTRHQEAFRYVRFSTLWGQTAPKANVTESEIKAALSKQPTLNPRLVFVDGIYRADLSSRLNLPKNIVINDLKTGFLQYGPFLDAQWTSLLKEEKDPFALLNAACSQGGLFLYTPPNSIVKEPIELLQINTEQHSLAFPRIHATFGRGSEITLLSRTLSLKDASICTVSSFFDCLVEEEARVQYIEPPLEDSKGAHRFDAIRVRVKRGGTFKALTAIIDGSLIRKSWHGGLFGEGAELYFEGAVCLSGEQQAHINIEVEHEAPHCRSQQLFKSVLNDASRMSFGGNILVRKRAQKTEAYQLNNNLLLGQEAHVDSTPRLEIFADDVKASHGATVGQIDQEQLLYFLTRGIPQSEARKLLLAGFFQQVTENLSLLDVKAAMQKSLEEAVV